MSPVSQAPRRYQIELAAAFVLYIAALFGRAYLLKFAGDPALKIAITLSPILAILFMALVIYRFYRGVDEYHRLRLLKVGAVSGGITVMAAASWSFLQDIGAPPLTNFGALMVFACVFSLSSFLYRLEDAASEGRVGRLGRGVSWAGAFTAAGAGAWLVVASLIGLPWAVPLALFAVAAALLVIMSLRIGPSAGLV